MADEVIVPDPTPPADPPQDPPQDPPADPPADPKDPAATPPEEDNEEPEKYDTTPPAKKTEEKPPADDTELPEEDQKAIEKLVEKKYGKYFASIEQQAEFQHKARVESELSKILTDNPEYKPYEAKIRKFVTHENRAEFIKNGLPVKVVVNEAIAPYLQKIGAEKAKAADIKANTIKVNGEQKGNETKGKVDYASMTSEQIREMGEQVKAGRYTTQA